MVVALEDIIAAGIMSLVVQVELAAAELVIHLLGLLLEQLEQLIQVEVVEAGLEVLMVVVVLLEPAQLVVPE